MLADDLILNSPQISKVIGVEDDSMKNLFEDIAAPEKLHSNYQALKKTEREEFQRVILDWANGFQDRDGKDKFRHEFQTTFNSSFWELYLYAVFKKLGLDVDFSKHAPDFCIPSEGINVEAVVANAGVNDVQEWDKTFEGVAHADVLTSQAVTIERLSNSIFSKLKKFETGYKEQEHVKDKAFVIAVGSFGTEDFFQLGDVAAQRLIYDCDEEKTISKRNGAEISLGLFKNDAFSDVSAIMFSSTASMGKVRAISGSMQPAFFQATRIKDLIHKIDASAPVGEYRESLGDGLRVFHNRNAKHPISPHLFGSDEDIMQFFYGGEDDYVIASPNGDLAMRQVMVGSIAKKMTAD